MINKNVELEQFMFDLETACDSLTRSTRSISTAEMQRNGIRLSIGTVRKIDAGVKRITRTFGVNISSIRLFSLPPHRAARPVRRRAAFPTRSAAKRGAAFKCKLFLDRHRVSFRFVHRNEASLPDPPAQTDFDDAPRTAQAVRSRPSLVQTTQPSRTEQSRLSASVGIF